MSLPPGPFPGDVDVAVVTHNGRATLPRVLQHLIAAGAPPERIAVYDIGSTDGTAEWIGKAWPAVRVVTLAENVGPNPARNRALADATRPLLLLVDSDAYLGPEVPLTLAGVFADDTGVGVAVPVVVHDEQPDTIQYASGRLHYLCEAINPWQGRPLDARGGEPLEIGTAPGVCLMLDVAAARVVGGFDDAYFLGKEDGEFCYRLRVSGRRIVEDPRAVVAHRSRARSNWLFSYQVRNRWHFILKNYQAKTILLLLPALAVHDIAQALVLVGKGEARAWWTAARQIGPMCRTIRTDRRRVARSRRVPDGDLLDVAPLLVRADLVAGRGLGAVAKTVYDKGLALYWRLVRPLLR